MWICGRLTIQVISVARLSFVCIVALLTSACVPEDDTALHAADEHRGALQFAHHPTLVVQLAEQLPPDLPTEALAARLPRFLEEAGRASRQERPLVREALLKLREQPNAVEAFTRFYTELPETQFAKRRLLIALVGELQRDDAFTFLKEVVWVAPQRTTKTAEGYTADDFETVIAIKAVHGLTFIRMDDGTMSEQAMNESLNVMKNHHSPAVRIAAIDAYMWNHGDSREAAAQLRAALDPELHRYIGRPRFHAGINEAVWRSQMEGVQ